MPNVVYTVAERVEMVLQHAQGLSYQKISDHFAAAYPNRPIPSGSTIAVIVRKFRKTGSINANQPKIIRPSSRLSEETKLDICLKAEEDENKTLSQIAKELYVSKTSVQKVLKEANCRPSRFRKPYMPCNPNKFRSSDLLHVDVKLEPMQCEELNVKTEPVDTDYSEVDESDSETDPLKLKTELMDVKETFMKSQPFPEEP